MDRTRSSSQFSKGRKAPLNLAEIKEIDYKDTALLKQFVTERGKILPRRITGLSSRQQRILTKAIKRARCIALMPFVATDM